MTPYPMDPADARGPMRIVLTTYPDRPSAERAVGAILRARLAACAHLTSIRSAYWWNGRLASGDEVAVTFKTVPKFVGEIFRAVRQTHPYDVPLVAEIDTHRVEEGYLAYLAEVLDPSSPPPPLGGGPTRRGGPRVRGGRAPGRTRARRRPRSTRRRTRR